MVRGACTWCQATWFAKGRRLHARFPPPTGKISTHNYRVLCTTWVHHLGAELLWSHCSSVSVTYLGAIAYVLATFVCPVSMFCNFCFQYGSLCCTEKIVFSLQFCFQYATYFQWCHSGLVAAVCHVKQSAFTCFFRVSAQSQFHIRPISRLV
jgi:hypothetical protein